MAQDVTEVHHLDVGILLCGYVRDAIKRAQFCGLDVQYIESSGWIERRFVLKGKDAGQVARTLDERINSL